MELHFSPMQGYVDNAYRRLHAEIYGGIDAYYTPFIRIEKGQPRRQDMTRLEASADDGTPLIPQIIFGSVDEFKILTDAVKASGFNRIDLNLGCPYPMQTRKGRGTAMITDLDTMRQVTEAMAADTGTVYSVKMRIGDTSPDQWRELIDLLNQCQLEHIAVHPRIASQMYDGTLYTSEFADLLKVSTNPVIWNGDLRTPSDIDNITTNYPGVKGVMIGRGMLARPSLAVEWRNTEEWTAECRHNTLLTMHGRLLDIYESTLCGATQILQKIKPFWEYSEPEIDRKSLKAIRKATTIEKYRAAVDSMNFINA